MNKKKTSKPRKMLYIFLGIISLSLGVVGIVLPILPTAPFIVLSAWFFLRGSPRFHNWLVNHPYFGPLVEEYSNKEGMKKESKIKAIIIMWTAVLLTAIFILDSAIMRIIIIGLASMGTITILRIETRHDNK